MPTEPAEEPLARNRDFKVLLSSQGISSLGDGVSFTALPLLVLALTGSGFAMGIVGALQTIPDFFVGMVAGAMADRSDRKRMMFLADLGRAGLTALIPISVALGGPTMAVILLVAAPMSILRSFFLAGYTASMPTLVGRSLVGRANSYFEAIYSMGYIIGPAIAGVLAATIGPGPTLAIDAVSFAVSAVGLAFVRRDLRAPVDRPRQRLVTEIREGIDYIATSPVLRSAILFWGSISILLAPLVLALTVHVTRDLGYTPFVLGLILAAYGVGTVAGALVSARRIGRGRVAEVLVGGNLVLGLSLVAVSVAVEVPVDARGGRRGRRRPVDDPRHVHHAADRLFARCAPGPDRQHRPDGVARPPAHRPPRRRCADRRHQRVHHDRGHRDRPHARQPRLHACPGAPERDARPALGPRQAARATGSATGSGASSTTIEHVAQASESPASRASAAKVMAPEHQGQSMSMSVFMREPCAAE